MFGPLSSPPQMVYSNKFSGALPSQIGQLTGMSNFMVSHGPSTTNDKHTRISSMRARKPHITSITIIVHNHLARLIAVHPYS